MANASIKAAFEQFWAHVVARLGDVIDQCKEYTDTNAVKYGDGTNVDKFTAFYAANMCQRVRIASDMVEIDGQDGEGVVISNDYLGGGSGYINGTPVLGLYGSLGDEPVRLMSLATPVDASDAANKAYVDAQSPSAVLTTLSSSGWDSNSTQTVSVAGILADESKQMILPMPVMADLTAYNDSGILLTAQAANSVTFTATDTPVSDIHVYVCFQSVEVVS